MIFEEDDWKLFSLSRDFGHFYLTYGVTGVPIESAFYAKPEDPPLPQPNYSSGCFLYFNNSFEFTQWDELGKWLKETYDWDVKDPKLALGYIPLGKLTTPYNSQDELIAKVAQHAKIRQVRLISTSGNEVIETNYHAENVNAPEPSKTAESNDDSQQEVASNSQPETPESDSFFGKILRSLGLKK